MHFTTAEDNKTVNQSVNQSLKRQILQKKKKIKKGEKWKNTER